jgi:hypothetical protein
VPNILVGGGLEFGEGRSTRPGERQDAAATIGGIGACFGETGACEFFQNAGQVCRVEPEILRNLGCRRPDLQMESVGEKTQFPIGLW